MYQSVYANLLTIVYSLQKQLLSIDNDPVHIYLIHSLQCSLGPVQSTHPIHDRSIILLVVIVIIISLVLLTFFYALLL